ncbi:mitotic checkpoint protein BUB3-like protein [Coemansia spiralis]|nr:mitotic checkpoint protein BUB3-like protein [Coemansia spiralis]
MSSNTKQYELLQPPTDGISQLKFHKTENNKLLVGSWDQQVRLYDVHANHLVASHHDHKAAVLDIAFGTSCAYSGGLDRRLLLWEADYTRTREIAQNSAALIKQIDVDERVYSISIEGDVLAVALAGRKILIYDIRKLEVPLETRESSLKYPTRCIRLMPDRQGFVCSSVEGRVAVEYLNGVDKSNYAFKCHRQPADNNIDLVYPVNAIAFHPVHHTFVTGGSDGVVSLWDPEHKKRLKQYQGYASSVASLDLNASGSILAVASSYTYDEGEKNHPPDSIWIRSISENEAKPKSKKS